MLSAWHRRVGAVEWQAHFCKAAAVIPSYSDLFVVPTDRPARWLPAFRTGTTPSTSKDSNPSARVVGLPSMLRLACKDCLTLAAEMTKRVAIDRPLQRCKTTKNQVAAGAAALGAAHRHAILFAVETGKGSG